MRISCFDIRSRRGVGEDDGDRITVVGDVLQGSPGTIVEHIVADAGATGIRCRLNRHKVLSSDGRSDSTHVHRLGRTVGTLAVDHHVEHVVVVRMNLLHIASVRLVVVGGVVVEIHRIVARLRVLAFLVGTLDHQEGGTTCLTSRLVVRHGIEDRQIVFVLSGSAGGACVHGQSLGAQVRIIGSLTRLLTTDKSAEVSRIGVGGSLAGIAEAYLRGHVSQEDLCRLEGGTRQVDLQGFQSDLGQHVIDINAGSVVL